ncbi:MAG: RluA family pseudouridine synthase [Bacteroidales bacterium]|jgi:23S rRNA pseudouridine1911/1915/1917 synthase|nr:RluA family pseudouridine synthase [Bacteroidales bacterium]
MSNKGKTKISVKKEAILMDFLLEKMGGMSRTKIKSLLKNNQVLVNELSVSKFDCQLKSGDIVEIDSAKKIVPLNGKIKIIYEDESIIVVDKGVGILTNSLINKKEKSVYNNLIEYFKAKNLKNTLFYVHRLDRDTSGVLLFAKKKYVQTILKDNWHNDEHEKIYFALVEGEAEKEFGTITSWLTEDQKSKKMYSCNFDNGGQLAISNYIVIQRTKKFTLLQVELLTGRKNQIRVQMQSIGHPVVGDEKYGAKSNPINRLGLHATSLTIKHPETGKMITFESKMPKMFNKF